MKTVSKTLRLSPDTIALIESWPGVSFTDKFTRMVYEVHNRREELQIEVDELRRQRVNLLQEISDLRNVRNSLNRLNQTIRGSIFNIGEIEKASKQALDCTKRIAGCDHD